MRSYPGVTERARADGTIAYQARYDRRRVGSRRFTSFYLGTYDDPLRAYWEVLNARANHAEKRALEARAEADAVLSGVVRKKRKPGRSRKVLAQ